MPIPLALTDILAVLFNEYFSYTNATTNWINQDQLLGVDCATQFAANTALSAIGASDTTQVNPQHAHSDYQSLSFSYHWQRHQANTFAQVVGKAYAQRWLQTSCEQANWMVCTHNSFVLTDVRTLAVDIASDAMLFASEQDLHGLIVLGFDTGQHTPTNLNHYAASDWQIIANVDGHSFEKISQAFNAALANKTQPSLIVFNIAITEYLLAATTAPNHQLAVLKDLQVQYAQATARINNAHPKAYDTWHTHYQTHKPAHPQLANHIHYQLDQLDINFASKAVALAEELQETEQWLAISDACLLAVHLLVEPLTATLIISYDETLTNLYKTIRADNAADATNKLLTWHTADNSYRLSSGLATTSYCLPFTLNQMSNFASALASILHTTNTVQPLAHCFVNNNDTHSQVNTQALYDSSLLNVWRPCDQVEAVIAVQQSVIKRNVIILADQHTPPRFERDLDGMDSVKLGGYCLFANNSAAPKVIFIAQGSEVAQAIACCKKYRSAAQVWSIPSMNQFFAQPSSHYQPLLQAQHLILSSALYWDICQAHLPEDKLLLLDSWQQ